MQIALIYKFEEDYNFFHSKFRSIVNNLLHITKVLNTDMNLSLFGDLNVDNTESRRIEEIYEDSKEYDITFTYTDDINFINEMMKFGVYEKKKMNIFIPSEKFYNNKLIFIPYIEEIFDKIFVGSEYEYHKFIELFLDSQTSYKEKIYLTKFSNTPATNLQRIVLASYFIELKKGFKEITMFLGSGNLNDFLKICKKTIESGLDYKYTIIFNKRFLKLDEGISLDEHYGNPNSEFIRYIDIDDSDYENCLNNSFITIVPFQDNYFSYRLIEIYDAFKFCNRLLINPYNSLEEFSNLNKFYKLVHFKYKFPLDDKNNIIEQTIKILEAYYNNKTLLEEGIADLGYMFPVLSNDTISAEWYDYIIYFIGKLKNLDSINGESQYNKVFNRRVFNYDKWSIIEDDIMLRRLK